MVGPVDLSLPLHVAQRCIQGIVMHRRKLASAGCASNGTRHASYKCRLIPVLYRLHLSTIHQVNLPYDEAC